MTPGPDDRRTSSAGDVQERGSQFLDAARALLGTHRTHCRFEGDHLRMVVTDLTAADEAALLEIAAPLGLTSRVRIERADAEDLRQWGRLRRDLDRLGRDARPLLSVWPGREARFQPPPVRIDLMPGPAAVAVAAELHERYGAFLSLHVGSLPYPPDPAASPPGPHDLWERDPLPPELTVTLPAPLTVRTGETVTRSLDLTNTGDVPVTVVTDGDISARVVTPATGSWVGGYAGAHPAPMVTFTAEPGTTVRIPLLAGTASFVPELGYSVPAGAWQLLAPLDLADGRHLLSPPLDLTVVD